MAELPEATVQIDDEAGALAGGTDRGYFSTHAPFV